MPIHLDQPAPMAPGFTAGAGAAQQYSRDLPSLVSLYESLNRGGGGHGGGGAAHYDTRQAMGQPFFGRGGGGGFSTGGGMSTGQDLNQAERIRLAKLQASDAAVEADDTLSPKEKFRYKQMLAAGINPLLQKQQQAKAQMMQQQFEQMHHVAAQQEAIRQENYKAGIQGVAANIGQALGSDGKVHHFMLDQHGKPIFIESKNAAAQEQLKAKQAEQEAKQHENDLKLAHTLLKETGQDAKQPTFEQVSEMADQIAERRQRKLAPRHPAEIMNEPGDTIQRYMQGQQQPQAAPAQPAIPNPWREKASQKAKELLEAANQKLQPPEEQPAEEE